MGIDAGFDMVPRLSKGFADEDKWNLFIKAVKEIYANDPLVEIKPNYIGFNVGEYPRLPLEGHKFLRFSSKISGHEGWRVEQYIDAILKEARAHFGDRVQYWNEAGDQWGFYNWGDVHDSMKSYGFPGDGDCSARKYGKDGDLNLDLSSTHPIPGKGKGLVALFSIPKGHRIIAETPLFTTSDFSDSTPLENNIASKLKRLSKMEQRQFLSLHNNFPGKNPFSGIVKTNALPCGPGATIGGVYSTISLINHSCLPNTHHSWNSNLKCETIHAVRDIQAGEEITISYAGGESYLERHMFLSKSFGFDCDCRVCGPYSIDDLRNSDARRESIQSLNEMIGDGNRVLSNPDSCLQDCFQVYQLLKEEYQDYAIALFAATYYDAFQICIMHGDQARASVFARRGYEARALSEGEDNPETERIKGLMENPDRHVNFGVSKRWMSKKNMVPKGLKDEEFEKWLWRQFK